MMKAMILAAGLGTRLGPLGAAMPKILIDVSGRSLLSRHVEYLETLGVTRIVINLHHRAELIETHVSELQTTVEILCIREAELLGTAGGVRNALPYLGSDAFLVVYGDVLFPDPVGAMVDEHARVGAAVTLSVHKADSAVGKGVVETDSTGRIVGFVEKGHAGSGSAWINSGCYVAEPEVIAPLPPDTFCDFGSDVFPALLAQGVELRAFALPRPVIDIGTPEGLEAARALPEPHGSATRYPG